MKAKYKKILRTICYLVIFVAAIRLITYAIYHAPLVVSETSTTSMADSDDELRYNEWCDSLTRYIIPRICDYYQLHPERFKPTRQDEEIEIEGFSSFVKGDDWFKTAHFSRVRWGKIRDPWGEPLHFVQDLNMDGTINARGQQRIVFFIRNPDNVATNEQEVRFGICKQSPMKGRYGNPWDAIFAFACYLPKNPQALTNTPAITTIK